MYVSVYTEEVNKNARLEAIECDDARIILSLDSGWPIAIQTEVEEPAFVRQAFTSLAGTENRTTSLEIRAWFNELRESGRGRLQRAVDTFRWRIGRSDATEKFKGLWIEISTDGESWRPPPVDFSEIRFGDPSVPFKTDDTDQRSSARELIRAGTEQPLSHELLREAWSQRDVSPRSAIVLAVAAIEVALKTYSKSRSSGYVAHREFAVASA